MTTLIEMVQWPGFVGWEGVTCHKCDATHNIMIGNGAILCERCGSCIVLSRSHYQRTHRKPDFGFNGHLLGWATKNFGRYKNYFKKLEQDIAKKKREGNWPLQRIKNIV